MGQICDGPMSKNLPDGMFYLCAKFHALIIKPTIRSKCFTYLLHYLHHAQFRVCQNAQISDIRVDIRMAFAEIQRFRIADSDEITLNI